MSNHIFQKQNLTFKVIQIHKRSHHAFFFHKLKNKTFTAVIIENVHKFFIKVLLKYFVLVLSLKENPFKKGKMSMSNRKSLRNFRSLKVKIIFFCF